MTVVIPSPVTALRAVIEITSGVVIGVVTGVVIALLIWAALAWSIAAMVGATVIDRPRPAVRPADRPAAEAVVSNSIGALRARATIEPDQIDVTVRALLDARRQLLRVGDTIGSCEGEA